MSARVHRCVWEDWQVPSRWRGNCPWLCDGGCVSAAVLGGQVTPRHILCTRLDCCLPGTSVVWLCAQISHVVCLCVRARARARALIGTPFPLPYDPHYASLLEPPPMASLRPKASGGREVLNRWGSRRTRRKGRAGPGGRQPRLHPEGPRPGLGGTPALPTSCPAGRPLPQLPLPRAS